VLRRRMTIKRLDPWSVLKFGIVANIVLFAILMLVAGVIWYIIDQLQLVDQACDIATDVGFTSCGINAGNLFRALALLGGMGVIVATAVLVFWSFLYNLISDLTGGIAIHVLEEGGPARSASATTGRAVSGPTPQAGSGRAEETAAHRPVDEGRSGQASGEPAGPPPRSEQPAGVRKRGEGDQLFPG
jgi:hypothetical protein